MAPLLHSLAVAMALGATLALQARLPARAAAEEPALLLLRPDTARLASLGFEALLADYYWLRAVQIVGGSRQDPSRHAELLGQLIDITTTLDPWVDHPYRFAALWLTDSRASVERANELLERGIAHHPREWRNRFYLGFNHFFYLGDAERAALALEPAIALPGAPAYLGRLLARLRAESGDLEVAAAFLQELARASDDPYARAEYEKALDEIQTERLARGLEAARAAYRERHGRDIERVEDLARGPGAVLAALPPEPHGWEWELAGEPREIVSSYYGRRYELNALPVDRERRERFRAQGPAAREEEQG